MSLTDGPVAAERLMEHVVRRFGIGRLNHLAHVLAVDVLVDQRNLGQRGERRQPIAAMNHLAADLVGRDFSVPTLSDR